MIHLRGFGFSNANAEGHDVRSEKRRNSSLAQAVIIPTLACGPRHVQVVNSLHHPINNPPSGPKACTGNGNALARSSEAAFRVKLTSDSIGFSRVIDLMKRPNS